MKLHAKTECGCAQQNTQGHDNENIDVANGNTLRVTAVSPEAANVGCCSTAFTGDEITGSNGAREIRGFGQELSFVSRGDESGMSAGCGCGPRGDFANGREQGQAPLRINLLDGTPLDVVVRHDVADVNSGVVDAQAGSPECCPGGEAEGCCQGNAVKKSESVEGNQDGCLCCGQSDSHRDRENATESGAEDRHAHHGVTEVAR